MTRSGDETIITDPKGERGEEEAKRSEVIIVSAVSLVFLALLGVLAARAGGAPVLKPTLRVTFWGALALALTAIVGSLFGTVV